MGDIMAALRVLLSSCLLGAVMCSQGHSGGQAPAGSSSSNPSPTNNMRGIGIAQGNTAAPFPMRGFEPKETWHHGVRQVSRTQVTGDLPAPQTGPFASSRHGNNFDSTAGATHPPVGTWLHPEDEFSSSQNLGPQSGFAAGPFSSGSMSGGQTSPYMGGYGMGGLYGGMGMMGGMGGHGISAMGMGGHYGNSHGMMFNGFPTTMGGGMMGGMGGMGGCG